MVGGVCSAEEASSSVKATRIPPSAPVSAPTRSLRLPTSIPAPQKVALAASRGGGGVIMMPDAGNGATVASAVAAAAQSPKVRRTTRGASTNAQPSKLSRAEQARLAEEAMLSGTTSSKKGGSGSGSAMHSPKPPRSEAPSPKLSRRAVAASPARARSGTAAPRSVSASPKLPGRRALASGGGGGARKGSPKPSPKAARSQGHGRIKGVNAGRPPTAPHGGADDAGSAEGHGAGLGFAVHGVSSPSSERK